MSATDENDEAARLRSVRDAIRDAAVAAKRDPAAIELIAVTKTFDADAIRPALAAGHRSFGENRVQEALAEVASAEERAIRTSNCI